MKQMHATHRSWYLCDWYVAIRANVKSSVIVHLKSDYNIEHVQWPSYMIHDAYSALMTALLNDLPLTSISNACMVLYAFVNVSLKTHRIYFYGSDRATQASVSSRIWSPPECAHAGWEDVRPEAWACALPPEITRRYHGVFWEQREDLHR